MSINKNTLTRGTTVLVRSRLGGPAETATVYRREVVKSYYPDGEDQVFYQLVGWGLMVPAADVTPV
jgi:hypothetical protein